jgi:N-hydroxyarylamine O-acetyltransferase
VQDYLDRLLVLRADVATANLKTLSLLVAAHVDRVCYENIDIKLGRALPCIDQVSNVSRVAVLNRGGYCFIIVGAFAALLHSLGFTVSLHTANCGSEPVPAVKWGDHVVVVVHLTEGLFIADVGLGEGPTSPWRLTEQAWTENGFPFSLEEQSAGVWRFRNPTNITGALPGFSVDINTSVVGVCEFEAFHRYYWSHKTSGYVNGPVALHRNLQNGRGLLSLHGCTLRRTHPSLGDAKYEVLRVITTIDEWFATVEEHFFMRLEDLTKGERNQLWQLVSSERASNSAAAVSPATAASPAVAVSPAVAATRISPAAITMIASPAKHRLIARLLARVSELKDRKEELSIHLKTQPVSSGSGIS